MWYGFQFSFFPFSFFSSPRTFFFFLVKKKDYRYTFPPSSSWPSCAGFRQIYFSKHLWTLGESRSLFAKGAFCSSRFWIMPYQAAMILTRALEKRGGGGGGVEGVNSLYDSSLLFTHPLSTVCDPPAFSLLYKNDTMLHLACSAFDFLWSLSWDTSVWKSRGAEVTVHLGWCVLAHTKNTHAPSNCHCQERWMRVRWLDLLPD